MKVQVKANVYIESDSNQFIIKEYTGGVDKHGKEIYKTVGYYTNVRDCLKRFLVMEVKDSTAKTLAELREDVLRIEQYIEKVMPV